jgi:hypothetical protein
VIRRPAGLHRVCTWSSATPKAGRAKADFASPCRRGPTVSRFAMRIGDRWQRGRGGRTAGRPHRLRRFPAPSARTRRCWRPRPENEFSARVFPIPANATKELIISYSQEQLGHGPSRIACRSTGCPRWAISRYGRWSARRRAKTLPASSLAGRRAQYDVVEVQKRNFKPESRLRGGSMPAVAGPGGAARATTWWWPAHRPLHGRRKTRSTCPSLLGPHRHPRRRAALGLRDQIAAFEKLDGRASQVGGGSDADSRGLRSGCGSDLQRLRPAPWGLRSARAC